MTNRDRILELLSAAERPLTDSEIRRRTGIEPHQQVNQICNSLAADEVIDRRKGADGLLVNSVGALARSETSPGDAGRANATEYGKLSNLELGGTLIVIPCSGRKLRGGSETSSGMSVVDRLPEDLAEELLEARKRNAPATRLDESRTMPAIQRYAGTLYEAATGAFKRIEDEGAEVAIMSGGYGVVAGGEPVGWYSQKLEERMWPEGLVARCLGAFAEAIQARTVVGFAGGSTVYAKVFRDIRWPETVENAWLISPELDGGGAQVKVPRAIGEALAEIADGGWLPEGWTSSAGVPVRVVATKGGPEECAAACAGLHEDRQVVRSDDAEPLYPAAVGTADNASGVRGLSCANRAGARRRRGLNPMHAARTAEEIAGDFYGGKLDLSARGGPSAPGWSDMPEVACVEACRGDGVAESTIRRLLTFVSAMDRARDADRLWRAGRELLVAHPEVFEPSNIAAMPIGRLSALLAASGVSQRHGPDSRAWQTIARSLATGAGPVRGIVERGTGDAESLLSDLRSVDGRGQARFPMLRGPKIGPMWVRIMANPGGAEVRGIEKIPVAVDVHVRRATSNLGVVAAKGGNPGKRVIQSAWFAAVGAGDVEGPPRIAGTCAALDPALWFFGKHGCRHCEAMSRRSPIGRACRRCVAFGPVAGAI